MSTTSFVPTFGERYGATYQLPADQCADHLLGRSLHAPLRWLWPIARGFCRYHLQDERLCLQSIMQLRSSRALNGELAELFYHPVNRKLHRRVLRIRVSTRRVKKLLKTLPEA